jgi:hypothetical protein
VQRIFAAGLSLQSVLAMATQAEVRRRVETSVADLNDAIRLERSAATLGRRSPLGEPNDPD